MFGTVAFKMLEWLTPHGLDNLTKKVQALSAATEGEPLAERKDPAPPRSRSRADSAISGSSPSRKDKTTMRVDDSPAQTRENSGAKPAASSKPKSARRNSNAKVRAASTKPIRRLSTDPFVPNAPAEDAPTLVSPRISGMHPEKLPRPPKTTQASTREISLVPPSPGGSSDDAESDKPVQDDQDHGEENMTSPDDSAEEDTPGSHDTESESEDDVLRMDPAVSGKPKDHSVLIEDPETEDPENDTETSIVDTALLPQSLNRLNFEIVEFLFSVLREDSTFESPIAHTRGGSWQLQAGKYKRIPITPQPYPMPMKVEWKRFVDQSIFYVMSDPHALVRSFTRDGKLVDSRHLWRCMVRLTDAAPSIVFHSLWLASANLFTLPKPFTPGHFSNSKSLLKSQKPLSNADAACLVSICLHALAAAAPEVNSRAALFDMSRLRSSGVALSGNGGPRLPTSLCLQYDDTFSNDLALRLAKRLFTALVARKHFATLAEFEGNGHETTEESNVLGPLLSQMDFLNSDAEIGQGSSPMPQALPILLLDWARAVIMQEWDGQAVFNPDSAFGGAMLFIETMYERKQELLLADVNFRLDYVADRLDSAAVPVDWLAFEPSRKRQHLLDRPFLFNPSHLVSYFRAINLARMSRSYEEPSSVYERVRRLVSDGLVTHAHRKLLQDMLRRTTSKYLILNVSRKTVARDAFDQLWQREERELVRPLKVHLGEDNGEEGFDLGGVQQEFFKLAFAQIFDPNYGAFQVDDRTRMAWFVPGSLLEKWKYELIGVLFSLAVYNGLTLPVTLPKAFYRKLLGEPVNELHHIADGWPELASGLTTLLEWDEKDGSVEDVFARTYEFSVQVFDTPVSRNMQTSSEEAWPRAAVPVNSDAPVASEDNPDDAPMVTYDNRSAYVSDYIKYLTDISVRPQYEAFERGFRACLNQKSLDILNSTVLQSIVEGTQEIDLSELKRYTRYNGWDASHPTIRDFWSIVKRYDEPMKRRLLEFVTASDRVPVGGMQNIQFVIQRNGEEGPLGRLPTAYTCYGTLLLPEYQDKDVLKERLGMALENAQGFGFG
ncbi:hypothetical protein jhhlp_003152 [Lomentospora prolificans]|uniref:HECT-type E3 ubiquitin transferase n=1 Tax=Lomentospora prolificans TaxID=41688 RepID=A0A2N3NG24_9PEZI|nr:hypothetical protein jhhlp_003152 [Lomentospora prolificans]